MQAIQVQRTGGPEVLTPADVEQPQPGPGEVRVQVTAIGVNFIDVYHRTGLYPQKLPLVPGGEGAGRVVAVGSGVDPELVGRRVVTSSLASGYRPPMCTVSVPSATRPKTSDARRDSSSGVVTKCARVGRVIDSEPRVDRRPRSKGGTGPLDWP